eukprot:11887583-Ditylum_brightwellii.AAC.1
MQLPTKEDYWKKGRVGAIVYPNFKAWITHIKLAADKAQRQAVESKRQYSGSEKPLHAVHA